MSTPFNLLEELHKALRLPADLKLARAEIIVTEDKPPSIHVVVDGSTETWLRIVGAFERMRPFLPDFQVGQPASKPVLDELAQLKKEVKKYWDGREREVIRADDGTFTAAPSSSQVTSTTLPPRPSDFVGPPKPTAAERLLTSKGPLNPRNYWEQ